MVPIYKDPFPAITHANRSNNWRLKIVSQARGRHRSFLSEESAERSKSARAASGFHSDGVLLGRGGGGEN